MKKKHIITAALLALALATGASAREIDNLAPSATLTNINGAEMEHLMKDYNSENNAVERAIEALAPGTDEEVVEYVIETEPGDSITEQEVENALAQLQNQLTEYAKSYLGTPYVWGAKGPKSFDCSGFTTWVFKNFGYDIGHGSKNQATKGKPVELANVRVGDLMFFSRPSTGNGVGHVGMVIDVDKENGTLKFIHASTKKGVTIQHFPDNGYFNRRFLNVRRVIDENELG